MTDEQMDARLRDAGEAWRAATALTVTEVELGEPHALTAPIPPRARRNRTGLLASAAVVAAALVAGGSVLIANINGGGDKNTQRPGQEVALEGTVWRFIGFGDNLQNSSLATFYISKDGQLVADDSCDLIGGRVTVDGDQLSVSQTHVNYYNCVDTSGEVVFEPDVLTSDPHYALDPEGTLTITGAGRTMHLVADSALPVPTLDRPTITGATWKLDTVTDPNGNDHPVTGDATFRIDDGNLRANDTCNPLNANVSVTGLELDITNVAIGASGCLGDVGATAQVVDAVLGQTAHVILEGTKLTVGLSGAGTLEYEWVPSDTQATDPSRLTDRTWYLTAAAGDPVTDNVNLSINSDGTVNAFDGCRKVHASAQVSPGSFSVSGMPSTGLPTSGCDTNLATTVDSVLTFRSALWHLEDGDLIVNGPNAQGFGLVFQLTNPNPPPPDVPSTSSLINTPWTLVTVKDADGTAIPVAGSGAFSIDANGHLKGNDGCNAMSGDVQLVDQTIDFGGGLAITEMACSDDNVMTTAQHVDAVLQGSVEWSIDGDRLTLHKAGIGTLVYRGGSSDQLAGPPLDNTTWTLTTIEEPGANGTASSVVTDVTAVFDGAGHVTITHRCYTDQADADAAKGTLDISDKHLQSAIPCPATQNQAQEQQENQIVDDVLSGHSTWTIDENGLQISKDGIGTLVFVA